jgi:hypothetical protein
MRPSIVAALAVASLAVAGFLTLRASEVAAGSAPQDGIDETALDATVALIATHATATTSSLYLVSTRAREDEALAPVASMQHAPDATVRAAVAPGTTTIFATAEASAGGDASFASALHRLTPHTPDRVLCDRVVVASSPLVTADGRVFVARGVAGNGVIPRGELRLDALSIDEIDPETGDARVVFSESGYLTYLAAARGDELIVYAVGPDGGRLLAVHRDTGATRDVIAKMPPFARDFSLDAAADALVYTERDEDAGTWVIERASLATGARTRLTTGPSMSLAPHVWPTGGVALSPRGLDGLALLASDGTITQRAPLGPGVDLVKATSPRLAVALHQRPHATAVPFLIDTTTLGARPLAAPRNARLAIAGFVTSVGGAR